MRRWAVFLGLMVVVASLSSAAYAFQDLSIHFPAERLSSGEYLFIPEADPLYARYKEKDKSGDYPFVAVTIAQLKTEVSQAEIQRLVLSQSQAVYYYEQLLLDLDAKVVLELSNVGIGIINLFGKREQKTGIPTSIRGQFGEFTFLRETSYWEVRSENAFSDELTSLIYRDKEARQVIRLNGGAGKTLPVSVASVNSYHIDTLTGLRRFIQLAQESVLRTYPTRGLYQDPPPVLDVNTPDLNELDEEMIREFFEAGFGIEEQFKRANQEVPYLYVGRWGNFTAERKSTYWQIKGVPPDELAAKLYADPIGRQFIRVNGNPIPADPKNFGRVTSYHIDNLPALTRFVSLTQEYYRSRAIQQLYGDKLLPCLEMLNEPGFKPTKVSF